MAQSYLDIAAHVLSARGLPMTAQQILAEARQYGLMPDHISGATMQKTLQARISEDISSYQRGSRFYRTAQGTYFLRSQSDDPTLPTELVKEYPVSRRKQAASRGKILCTRYIPQHDFIYLAKTDDLANAISIFSSYEDGIPDTGALFGICVFVIVKTNDHILTHRTAKYSHLHRIFPGLSLGFHRFVDEYDMDLLDDDGAGVNRAAVRACAERMDFSKLKIDDRDIIKRSTVRGVIVDPRRRRLGVTVRLDLDHVDATSINIKRRLDVKEACWLPINQLDVNEFDMWSFLVIQKFV